MLCVIKVTLESEFRRFTLANIHLDRLDQDASRLSYTIIHEKICSLFNQTNMAISYEDHNGVRKTINKDADVLEAIASFSKQAQPSPSVMVVRLDVEPYEREVASAKADDVLAAKRSLKDLSLENRHNDTGTAQCNRSCSDDKQTSESVHPNVYCDNCLNTVRGTRWKCQDCDNYDLCQNCHKVAGLRHPCHTFKPIEKYVEMTERGSTTPSRQFGQHAMQHHASCDLCLNSIVGVRHKCFQCPDYDLCQGCLPLAKTQHKGHTFIPIAYHGQIQVKVDQTPHYGVVCDGCDNDIYGVRYKCGNCADYDLCGNCEALPEAVHDPSHIMLKIRRPISSSMTTPTPLLPQLYKKGWGQAVCHHPQQTGQKCPMAALCKPRQDAISQTSSQDTVSKASEVALNAVFVKDITHKDGTVVQAGASFMKIWELANPGPAEWPEGTVFQFVGGDRMFSEDDNDCKSPEVKVDAIGVAESLCVSANLKVPSFPGRYISYWRLVSPSGELFGQRVWCDIVVEEPTQIEAMTTSAAVEQAEEKKDETVEENEEDSDDDFVVVDTEGDM
ncbi:hypothetical protein BC939DRAFT_455694 [Gamsiella multidivaricata]|uniref:uncharacterized protein n=1 Tax=Gamsiella multidivaricata TaxID=101098 RepID=UPI00221EF78A|nr:uncharacterized protein BC939DRAFT_455694 [Gamsiella multidivaricata]KAG0366769.1 hypothetical protein BGZ54_004899 [Gamsiella multidivaricata]KAI7821315.1 hypothetical protein BC939DRAFT_455694 [Gamsiella multidivaricata]